MPSTHPYEDAFPSPLDTLNFERGELQGALETGLLVLDANVLLALYGKTAQTQNAIAGLFVQAHEAGRLVVPEHSLREYLSNRAEKLAGELEALRTLKSKAGRAKGDQDLHLPDTFAPFALAGPANDAIERLRDADEALKQAAKQAQESLDELIEDAEVVIREKDPVMAIVQSFADESSVEKLKDTYDEVEKEAKTRLTRPPLGDKKDLNKRNGNELGDYLVWKALLQAAESRSADGAADTVFVTNDTKPNWWADKGDDGPVMPRDELTEEYRTTTGGGTLHLLTLDDYVEMMDAEETVVVELRQSSEPEPKSDPESEAAMDAWSTVIDRAFRSSSTASSSLLTLAIRLKRAKEDPDVSQEDIAGLEAEYNKAFTNYLLFKNMQRRGHTPD
ncbi:PIN domain-containing protein [Rubricoccus marinus]|uniref:PIN like domain-containing protein n=1 Tax=Rubricoccus marinus TaxID=716817 RepID=A0A259U228_9BACT|nr:PIN domain-containing protein [Rubricoccus marinus]OZC04021.1 hypothetical protein BSZ36_14135 [Rubricoccus marinus]